MQYRCRRNSWQTRCRTRTARAPPLRVAIMPWVILTVIVFAWGTPQVKGYLNHLSAPSFAVPGLDKLVMRAAPVVPKPTARTRGLPVQLAVGERHGDSDHGAHHGPDASLFDHRACPSLSVDAEGRVALTTHHLRDARARIYVALLGFRRDPRSRVRAYGSRLSVLRRDAGMAWRRSHRERHVVECAVREPADDHGAIDWVSARY